MRVRTSATQKWPFVGLRCMFKAVHQEKLKGVLCLNPCEIQGAQHVVSMRKRKFYSHLLDQLKLGASRGHWALLELSLDVACCYLIFIYYFMFVFSKKEAD